MKKQISKQQFQQSAIEGHVSIELLSQQEVDWLRLVKYRHLNIDTVLGTSLGITPSKSFSNNKTTKHEAD